MIDNKKLSDFSPRPPIKRGERDEEILCASLCTQRERRKTDETDERNIIILYRTIYIRSDLKKLSIGGMTARNTKIEKNTTIIKTKEKEKLSAQQTFLLLFLSSLSVEEE